MKQVNKDGLQQTLLKKRLKLIRLKLKGRVSADKQLMNKMFIIKQ